MAQSFIGRILQQGRSPRSQLGVGAEWHFGGGTIPILPKVLGTAAEMLFPRVCAICGGNCESRQAHICWECFRDLPLLAEGCCEHCGHPIETREQHEFLCWRCRRAKPSFERARVAGRFSGKLRYLVHHFKYNKAMWLADDLAELIYGCLLAQFASEEIDVVVPVPLYRTRARSRGYNQAALLAVGVAERLGRPCRERALRRLRQTSTQTRLTANARLRNVSGAFAVLEPTWIAGRTVLLVDDVMTTGATFNAVARTLKRSGAFRVWAAAIARGN